MHTFAKQVLVVLSLIAVQAMAGRPAPLATQPTWEPSVIKTTPEATFADFVGPDGREIVSWKKSIPFRNEMQADDNYRQLVTDWGSDRFQNLKIVVKNDKLTGIDLKIANLKSQPVLRFVETVEAEKFNLMRMYGLTNREYNRLAVVAFGILGNESKFFTHYKYFIKEVFPEVTTTLKQIKAELKHTDVSPNSHGPTQIKVIPKSILDFYGASIQDLNHPRSAAIATMGILIEKFYEIRRSARNNDLSFISEMNIYDFIAYKYLGKNQLLISGQVKPWANAYNLGLIENIQYLELYETRDRF